MQLTNINPTLWGHHAKAGRSAAKLRERAAGCCTDATIILNGAATFPSRRRRFSMYYDAETYRDAFSHLRDLGVTPHVMSWVRPDVEQWIEPMADAIAELREHAPFESVLLDAEGEWTKGWPGKRPPKGERVDGWDEAGAELQLHFGSRGLEYGVSDIGMVSPSVVRALVAGARYVMPQVHEFGLRGGIRAPGAYVQWMHDHWPKWVHCEIRPHLAFYGVTQTEAGLRRSIEACLALGYGSVGGWTSRKFGPGGIRRVLAEYTAEIRARGAQEVSWT